MSVKQLFGEIEAATCTRPGEKLLFFVSHSIDSDIVVYKAIRKNNELTRIDHYTTSRANYSKILPIEDEYKDSFMPHLTQKEGEKGYQLRIEAFDRPISLHLKKSGNVVAKTTLIRVDAAGKSSGICSRVFHIRLDYEKGMLGTLTPSTVHIYGQHSSQQVSEKIQVTSEMMLRHQGRKFASSLFGK